MITIEPPANLKETLSRSGLTNFLNRARLAVGLRGDVEVLLADDPTLRGLNKSFRGKNKPTDVLSFPTPADIADSHAGDLAISLETAARQAATYGHSLRDEVRILLLHGLLHLSGLDHETDTGEMAAREASLRRQLKLSNTLIERTAVPPRKLPAAKKSVSRLKKPSARLTKKYSTLKKESSSRPKAALYAAAVESPPHPARTMTKSKASPRLKKPSVPSTKTSSNLTKESSSRQKAALHAAAVERPPHSVRTSKKVKAAKTKKKAKNKRGAK